MYADDRLKLQVTARHMNKIELDKQARDNSREIADANPARLGTRLKLARQTRGMTLKALADAANCSESLLSKIENGKASPSLPMLHRLVQALETNIGWMFEESMARRASCSAPDAAADRARSAAARRRHLARTHHSLFAGPSAPVQHPPHRKGRRKRRARSSMPARRSAMSSPARSS